MSHRDLQRVVVRLLHDPRFVQAMYRDPVRALDDAGLTIVERRWLLATPPPAWTTDPERPARVLAALREEFAVSTRGLSRDLGAFFASRAFHDAVQADGSLAAAFGAWLQEGAPPAVAACIALDAAVARVRRAPRHPVASPNTERALTPAAVVLSLPHGSLARYHALQRGEVTDTVVTSEPEALLVFRAPARDEITIEELPEALAEILTTAQTPCPRATLIERAQRLGADAAEAEAIIENLETDGLLL